MPAFTAQTLIGRAATQADMHDGFVTPAEWLSWLNTEIRALDIFCARAGYVLPAATQTSVTAVPYTITVPGEMLAVVGVWEVRDDKYRRLSLQNAIDINQQDPTTGRTTGDAQSYSVTRVADSDDHTVTMYPRPTTGTYMVVTIPPSRSAAAMTTSLWYPLGFEERLVLKMAIRALGKENSDPEATYRLLGITEQMIEEASWSRQIGEAPVVRNVDDVARGWNQFPMWPQAAFWSWL